MSEDPALTAARGLGIEVDRVVAKFGSVTNPWVVETPISVNNTTVEIGQNGHSWGGGLAGRWQQVGCKRALLSMGVNHFTGSWPGTDNLVKVTDQMCRELHAAGIKVTLGLLNYPSSNWSAFVTAAATSLRGIVSEYNINNEPNDMAMTFAALQASYPLIKAADPAAQVLGPCTTADFANGFTRMKALIALNPWPVIDLWNWHTYYDTPEGNYLTAMLPASALIKRPLLIGEVGWQAWDNQPENANNVVYPTAKVSDFYSFYSFLAAAVPGMKAILYYALVDEAPSQWGVFKSGWTEKSYAPIFRAANAQVHAATGFAAYSRGGRDKINSRWFVRFNTATGPRVAMRSPAGPSVEKIWCIGANVTTEVLGTAATVLPIPGGRAQMSIPIGTRATVLSGCTFPEFP